MPGSPALSVQDRRQANNGNQGATTTNADSPPVVAGQFSDVSSDSEPEVLHEPRVSNSPPPPSAMRSPPRSPGSSTQHSVRFHNSPVTRSASRTYRERTAQSFSSGSPRKRKVAVGSSSGSDADEPDTNKKNIPEAPKSPTLEQYLFPKTHFERLCNSGLKGKMAQVGAGLRNVGNTCFANSVLQALAYTTPLVAYCFKETHSKQCKKNNWCALCSLEELVIEMRNGEEDIVTPMDILNNLRSIGKNFRFGEQEDAHEFLRYLVDSLHTSCLEEHRCKFAPHVQRTTFIHQLFGGRFESQVTCGACDFVSKCHDPFLDISLDINRTSSVYSALRLFTEEEALGGGEYQCEKCKQHTNVTKRFTVYEPPPVLAIQLKRFKFGGFFSARKLNHSVAFDEWLDLSKYMSSEENVPKLYELYAVIVHIGWSMSSGHYVCYVKVGKGGKNSSEDDSDWYLINDSRISRVETEEVLSQKAYILLYRETNHDPTEESYERCLQLENRPRRESNVSIDDDEGYLGMFEAEDRCMGTFSGCSNKLMRAVGMMRNDLFALMVIYILSGLVFLWIISSVKSQDTAKDMAKCMVEGGLSFLWSVKSHQGPNIYYGDGDYFGANLFTPALFAWFFLVMLVALINIVLALMSDIFAEEDNGEVVERMFLQEKLWYGVRRVTMTLLYHGFGLVLVALYAARMQALCDPELFCALHGGCAPL